MVTHNMQQAARISDKTAFFLLGEVVEFGRDRTDLQPAEGSADRRIHYREVWLMRNQYNEQLKELHEQMIHMGKSV